MISWFKNTFSFWTGLLELKIICHGSHLQPVWQVTDGKFSYRHLRTVLLFAWLAGIANEFSFIAWKWRWIFPPSFWATIAQWVFGNSTFFSPGLAFCAGGRSLLILWSKVDLIFGENSILCLWALMWHYFISSAPFCPFSLSKELSLASRWSEIKRDIRFFTLDFRRYSMTAVN